MSKSGSNTTIDRCRASEELKPGATFCARCWRYHRKLCAEGKDGGWKLKRRQGNGVWERERTMDE